MKLRTPIEYLRCPLCSSNRHTHGEVIPACFTGDHVPIIRRQLAGAGPGRGKKGEGRDAFQWTERPLTAREHNALAAVIQRLAANFDADFDEISDGALEAARAELDFRLRQVNTEMKKRGL